MTTRNIEVAVTVEGILDVVREHADEVERSRRIPDDVLAVLRETGINRLFLPSDFGGLPARVVDVMDVAERIAAVDGSTGWCAVIGSGSNIFAGYLPEAGARTVFADPDQGSATMLAPHGRLVDADGRFVLSGRWPFTSNCLHSAWIGLSALMERPDGLGPVPWVVFVPRAELVIEDSWHSVGLRGTGSHHVTAHEVVVGREQCISSSAPAWAEGPMWRLPVTAVLLPSLTSVPLGIARGALDEISRQAREGRNARRGLLADDPISLAELAAADARLRSARAGLREVCDEAYGLAVAHAPIPRGLQARIALACMHASDVSVDVTGTAHRLAGGASAYSGNRLLRALCDVEAARQHFLLSHHHLAQLGKIFVGLDGDLPPLVV